MDILELFVDPSIIEGTAQVCEESSPYFNKCLPFDDGWECLHEFENQSDLDIATTSDVSLSELVDIISPDYMSPSSYSSESGDNFLIAPEKSDDSLPKDVADFIDTYAFQNQNNNYCNVEYTFPQSACMPYSPGYQWRKIQTNIKSNQVIKQKHPEINIQRQFTKPVCAEPFQKYRAPPVNEKNKNLTNNYTTNSKKERKKDSNRLSAHRYREKKKALTEGAKQELIEAVHQYKRAKSAYDKAVDAFSEMEKLVLGIINID